VDAGDLPPALRAPSPAAGVAEDGAALPVALSLEEVEREHVEKVLALCGWNRSQAARVLGIDRRTLFTKVQRYGLAEPARGGARDEDED
jgi:transcriptional regulator of acetoin/glycerol metabolism